MTETTVNLGGQDWQDVVDAAMDGANPHERIVVNMGPQHPSTHGVLRLILEIDGETITEARCGIGYLHTGIEKNLEYRNWTQGVTFVTRMDYLSPFFNETVYCLGVEKLLGITDDIPERATVIRVLLMELNRISSHLVALATGGMELGAMSAMFFGFRDREAILTVYEAITGLRMNHAYIRPGGIASYTVRMASRSRKPKNIALIAPSSMPPVASATRWLEIRLSSISSTRMTVARSGMSSVMPSSFSTPRQYTVSLKNGDR